MNVNLTPHLEAFVQKKVQSGRYNSASEVVREALRLLEERDSHSALKLQALREAIGEGLADLDNGNYGSLSMADIKRLAREGINDKDNR